MAKNGVFGSDPNNPNAGYDVYFNGKLIGWFRYFGDANRRFNQLQMATTSIGQGSGGGNPSQSATAQRTQAPQPTAPPATTPSQAPSSSGQQAKGKGGSLFTPQVNVNVQTGKETDWITIFAILLAYAIWVYDLFPIHGGLYKGYQLDKLLLTNTNWVAVFTSSAVVAFLVWNIFTDFFNKDLAFIYSFTGLLILNSTYVQRLNYFSVVIPNFNWIFLGIVVLFVLYLRYFKDFHLLSTEYSTYLLMVLVYSFFYVNWSWTTNIKAIVHVAFISIFCLGYLNFRKGVDKSRLYIFTSMFLIADFFLYTVDIGNVVLAYFPLIVVITSFYCMYFTESKFANANFFLLLVIFVFFVIFTPSTTYGGEEGAPLTPREATKGITDFWGDVKKFFLETLPGKAETSIDIATGGQFKPLVEKNQFEPLGVVFERVRASQPRFYSDEPVTLWVTIKSRTLSDPVFIDFNCYRWKEGKRYGIKKEDGTINRNEGTLIPERPFVVYTLEEKDVECTFQQDPNKPLLPAGINTVTMSAIYNFATSAYKKTYFIDKDRDRAMRRENLDPLKEFGITETKPATFYTNGPVEIDIILQNLIPVSEDIDVSPLLGIKLVNRDKISDKQGKVLGKWDGKIKKINELVVVLPETIELEKDKCTPVKFKTYTPQNCDESCRAVCKRTCGIYSDKTDSEKKNKCIKDCEDISPASESTKKCNEECTSLFKSETEDILYKGYQLDVKELETRYKDEYKDIDRYRDFACRITPKPQVLENVPITTKFIRVKARYDYLLEKSFSVPIEQPPEFKTPVTIPEFEPGIPLQAYSDENNKNEVANSPIVFEVAKEQNIDYLLIKSIIQVENSKWDPSAKGDIERGGSFGLMQININTAKEVGCTGNWQTDVKANINCGVKALKTKYNLFNHKPCKEDKECKHPFTKNFCESRTRLCKSRCANVCEYEFTGRAQSRYYSGWQAALRAYNGWDIGGNDAYVEQVMDNYNILKSYYGASGVS